jgi:hypothetical protein
MRTGFPVLIESLFKDGFCHAHPLRSWRMDGKIVKIISGGQTGAGRAALDFAIEHGIPHGGWRPKGRRSEDGPMRAFFITSEAKPAGMAASAAKPVVPGRV